MIYVIRPFVRHSAATRWSRARGFFLIIALAFSCLRLVAAPNEQKEIQELYRRGLAGDKESVTQCIAQLEGVLHSEPNNQLARVYLGSSYTLRSRDLGFGPSKLQALRKGLALMDEAVAAAPKLPKIRLTRALTTSALPAILGRSSSSRADFETLAENADREPEKFEAGDLEIIYYNAGLAAKGGGNHERARASWRKTLAHSSDPALAEKARTELAASTSR